MAGPTPAEILGLIGATLGGRYRIRTIIGAGGLSGVYEALDKETGDLVALKLLLQSHTDDHAARTRFEREVKVLEALDHPNVVRSLGHGEDAGRLFLVLERLYGEDLDTHLLRNGALALEDALTILLPAMDGVAAAHRLGVLHRDLKPSNVYLADAPTRVVPKVIDFGLTRFFDSQLSSVNVTLGHVGTPAYMPPEQILGDDDLDPRADVWAMAALLFHALTGDSPFRGNVAQILTAIADTDPPRLSSRNAAFAGPLDDVLQQAMSRDPKERFDSLDAFANALRNATRAA